MGSDAKGEGPLTILTLCDRLQDLLVENDMIDAPIREGVDGKYFYPVDVMLMDGEVWFG